MFDRPSARSFQGWPWAWYCAWRMSLAKAHVGVVAELSRATRHLSANVRDRASLPATLAPCPVAHSPGGVSFDDHIDTCGERFQPWSERLRN